MRMSRRSKAWFVAVIIVAALFAGISALAVIARTKLDRLSEAIAELEEETIPLKFKVLDRGAEGLRVRIKFLDRDGASAGEAEAVLAGKSLYLDFTVVMKDGAYVAFPAAIFTDEVPAARGKRLFPAYDVGGYPAIFRKKGMDARDFRSFAALFLSLKLGRREGDGFGSAVHDVAEIGSFKPGIVYKVVSRKKGGIEVMED